ncbi:MAG TPA: sulfatase, partial [Vicinamibacteria bacterium]|nr:sulfatase [Vicinamibacteria bacterium]
TEWRFDDPQAAGQWKAGVGVEGLRSREGRLTGRSTAKVPIVHVERSSGLDEEDILHEVVVRARASRGSNLAITFRGSETVELAPIASRAELFPWPLTTPLVPGEELQTYRISVSASAVTSVGSADTRHVLLRPTDAEDADFEIESVRLVFRKEHLASIPSGVGWQGLGEIYRETIVSRSPEKLRFEIRVPERAFLDLALGTVEDGPVTFKVSAPGVELARTLTTPHRWEELTLDLGALAGREITLTLALEAEQEGALGFWGAPAVRSRESSRAPRGVLVFLLDTLRRDRLDAYGFERETAPNLSRLAAEGVLFEDAIAQGAWTKVSVPSILTSTYPTSNGIHELNHRMPASGVTLAEVFREAGYATWATSSVFFTGRGSNLHQGVEVLHEAGSFPSDNRDKNARNIVDRVLPWLESHEDVPFFVLIHAIDPHDAYEPNRPYDTLWAAPDAEEKHGAWTEKLKPFIENNFMKDRGLPLRAELEKAGIDPEEFVKTELDWYDGSIRGADVELGRLLEKLEELGIADDTLVVFLSDHGEEFLEHGGHFHEENVYGELVNVPLAMRWPEVLPAGRVVNETVQLLDLAPTILDLAGISVPERMQGQSLKPLLAASGAARWRARPAISEWRRRTDQLGTRVVDAFSIIEGEWKLIRNVARPDDVPEFELYHHQTDPLDQKNVASDHPEIVERLAQQLEAWHKWALERKLPSDGEAASEMTSEELQRLRSLGYVQ